VLRADYTNHHFGGDWKETIVAEIINLVDTTGGKVVFFEIPVSSINRQIGVPTEWRQSFTQYRMAHNIPYIGLGGINPPDSSFSDLTHLDPEPAKRFTIELANKIKALESGHLEPQRSISNIE